MPSGAHHTAAVVNGLNPPLAMRTVFNFHVVCLDGADMTTFVARLHAGTRAGLDFPGCGRWAAVSCRRRAGGVWRVGGVRSSGGVGSVRRSSSVRVIHPAVCDRSASGVGAACVVRAVGCICSRSSRTVPSF
jgi:hypothetical protein